MRHISQSNGEKYTECELQAAGTLFSRFSINGRDRLELAWLIHHEIPTRQPYPPLSKEHADAHREGVVQARVDLFAEIASRLGATQALLFEQVPGTPFTLLQYLFAHGDIESDRAFFLCAFNVLCHAVYTYMKREPTGPGYSTWSPDRNYSLCELAVDCIQRFGPTNKAVTVNMLKVLLEIGVPADAPGCVALPLAVMLGESTATKLLLLYGADPKLLLLYGVMPSTTPADASKLFATRNSSLLTNEQSIHEMKRSEIREFLSKGWLNQHWGSLKKSKRR